MKVLIASKNLGKIEGAEIAFSTYFNDVEVIGYDIKSDVSEQPLNEEIYQGAYNRVDNLIKYANLNELKADYYIAVESGLTNLLGKWSVVSVAIIKDKDSQIGFGTSAAYPIPEKYIEDILNTQMSTVMQQVFKDRNIRVYNGVIHHISHGKFNRVELNKQAFMMALTNFINADLWSD